MMELETLFRRIYNLLTQIGADNPADALPRLETLVAALHAATLELRRQAGATRQCIGNNYQLLAVIHEMSTPLQALHIFIHLVRRADGPIQARHLELAHAELKRLERLIGSLLTGSDASPDPDEAASLNALIAQILDLHRGNLARHNVTVESDLSPALPALPIPSDQFTQVVLNLIFNAIAAMPGGGVLRLRAGLAREAGAGAALVFEVIDTGCGIAPEVADRVFEPLFTTRPDGMGMGLALCRQIITQHGGQISFESAPGHGTHFAITIPL